MKAILTVGVSGSGKTTWANEFIRNNPDYVKIERDEIRHIISINKFLENHDPTSGKGYPGFAWKRWKWKWEKEVTQTQTNKIMEAATDGKNIIISDTNTNKKTRTKLTNQLEALGYEVELKEFIISWTEAIERNAHRPLGVDHSVLARQFDHLRADDWKYVPNPDNPKAVIVDVDGTIAKMHNRTPYEWNKVGDDLPHHHVIDVVRGLRDSSYKIIVLSGRSDECLDATWDWVVANLGFEPDRLIMRKAGDNRGDDNIKHELLLTFCDEYNIMMAIDDRPKICRRWRELGIPVLQVSDPYIEF